MPSVLFTPGLGWPPFDNKTTALGSTWSTTKERKMAPMQCILWGIWKQKVVWYIRYISKDFLGLSTRIIILLHNAQCALHIKYRDFSQTKVPGYFKRQKIKLSLHLYCVPQIKEINMIALYIYAIHNVVILILFGSIRVIRSDEYFEFCPNRGWPPTLFWEFPGIFSLKIPHKKCIEGKFLDRKWHPPHPTPHPRFKKIIRSGV